MYVDGSKFLRKTPEYGNSFSAPEQPCQDCQRDKDLISIKNEKCANLLVSSKPRGKGVDSSKFDRVGNLLRHPATIGTIAMIGVSTLAILLWHLSTDEVNKYYRNQEKQN